MTLTTHAPLAPSYDAPARRPPVDRPRITTVLVAHDGARWLPRTLAALAAQTRPPDVVVGVDTGSGDDSPDLLRAALGASQVLVLGRRTGFGAAVHAGLEHLDGEHLDDEHLDGALEGDWVWLLHDDSAPQPQALEQLLEAAARSSQVGIVGPKLVAWDDPTRLLEVGLTVSRGGRRCSGVADDERDQGQHDHRADVLAVGTAGLLVSRLLWDRLGGLDPALPLLRDDIDLCWRAHLAGHRVVLAPRAVVADAQAASRGLRRVDAVRGPVRRVDRRHGLHVALARCSWPALPLVLAWLVLGGVVRSVGLLAAKAPRRAADELIATLAVALTPWSWLGSRWRARGARSVRRRDVAGLLSPRLGFARHSLERLGGLAAREGGSVDTALVPTEPGPIADEVHPVALAPARWPRRILRHPMTGVLVVVAAATVSAMRALAGPGALAGGALLPAQGRPSDLWRSAIDSWSGPALGGGQAASPGAVVRAAATALLAPIAGEAAPARVVDILLLGAPLLAAVSAYLASALVVRSRWVRGWGALTWALLPVLTGAIDAGRLGPVAAAVLLPLVAAAIVRALSRDRAGAWRGVCTASLGLALLGAALPALLVAAALVGAGGILLAHGMARARAALLVALPIALLGPWVTVLLDDPRQLLAGPGALVTGPTVPSLEALAALVPLPAGWPAWVAAALVTPLLVAGLAGLLRAGRPARALLAVWAVGLLGLAAALAAPMVTLSSTAQGPLHPYAGAGLLLVSLAAVIAAMVGADGLTGRLARHRFGWRQLLVAPVAAAAVLAPFAAAVVWAWPGGAPAVQRSAGDTPAVAVDAARAPAALRTLVIGGDGADVTYALQGVEPQPWTRGLADPGTQQLTTGPVGDAVGALIGQSPSIDRLRTLAVGYVVVESGAPPRVTSALDTSAGLARLGADRKASLWRVLQPAGRVTIDAGGDLTDVPVRGANAAVDTRIAAGPAPRRLLLAQPASSGWRATLDGRPLAPVDDPVAPWRQAFTLPATGGRLVVEHVDPARRWWLAGQGALVGALLLLALPGLRPQSTSRGPGR